MITPVVLVHGMWHGSWCWSLVTGPLAAAGVPSLAVDLEGHGLKGRSPESRWSRPFDPAAFAAEPAPSAAVTASSAAADLVRQIRRAGGGRPCVVVMHSMGGVIGTAAAELAPELFAELVYLSAFAPVSGLPAAAYISSPESAGSLVPALLAADPAAIGALRQDTGNRAGHAAIREAFYHDVDQETADAAIGLLSPDGPAGFVGETLTITPHRYGSVPHTFIVCTEDKTMPLALQHRFIREIDAVSAAPTTVVELVSSHSPFLSMPDELAAAIVAAHRMSHSGLTGALA
jgi:pimeloyl-ACP methyl ester carboxylesterase